MLGRAGAAAGVQIRKRRSGWHITTCSLDVTSASTLTLPLVRSTLIPSWTTRGNVLVIPDFGGLYWPAAGKV